MLSKGKRETWSNYYLYPRSTPGDLRFGFDWFWSRIDIPFNFRVTIGEKGINFRDFSQNAMHRSLVIILHKPEMWDSFLGIS